MGYDKVNLAEVTDSAAEHGLGELQEARFPRTAVGRTPRASRTSG